MSVTDCAFTFASESTWNGTFTSPNYPGLYPRDVECHYLFYGADNTRVFVTFPDFDVDGIPPQYVPNSHRPPDTTRRVLSLSCLLCRCELDDCSERVQTLDFLSAAIMSCCRESNSHRRSGRDTDKTVLSCLAWRCDILALVLYVIGNESAPMQLAQCWFPGLAISDAKILIYFCK